MTHLRKIMLEELERRNHRQTTILSMASLSISIGLYQSLLLSEKNRLHNFFYTLLQGAALPKLVRRNMISQMKPGAVIVDVAIDQGGCVETAHATMHTDPVYYVDGVVLHYCGPICPPPFHTHPLSV